MNDPIRVHVSANGSILNFEAIPWCVKHDQQALNLVGPGWICSYGYETDESCDVRHDGSGNVWRFLPMGLEAWGIPSSWTGSRTDG